MIPAQRQKLEELLETTLVAILEANLEPYLKVMLLDRAINESAEEFRETLDKIYYPREDWTLETLKLNFLIPFKKLNDLIHNSEIITNKTNHAESKNPEQTTRTLEDLLGPLDPDTDIEQLQRDVQNIVKEKVESDRKAIHRVKRVKDEDIQKRYLKERNIQGNSDWRILLNLPASQQNNLAQQFLTEANSGKKEGYRAKLLTVLNQGTLKIIKKILMQHPPLFRELMIRKDPDSHLLYKIQANPNIITDIIEMDPPFLPAFFLECPSMSSFITEMLLKMIPRQKIIKVFSNFTIEELQKLNYRNKRKLIESFILECPMIIRKFPQDRLIELYQDLNYDEDDQKILGKQKKLQDTLILILPSMFTWANLGQLPHDSLLKSFTLDETYIFVKECYQKEFAKEWIDYVNEALKLRKAKDPHILDKFQVFKAEAYGALAAASSPRAEESKDSPPGRSDYLVLARSCYIEVKSPDGLTPEECFKVGESLFYLIRQGKNLDKKLTALKCLYIAATTEVPIPDSVTVLHMAIGSEKDVMDDQIDQLQYQRVLAEVSMQEYVAQKDKESSGAIQFYFTSSRNDYNDCSEAVFKYNKAANLKDKLQAIQDALSNPGMTERNKEFVKILKDLQTALKEQQELKPAKQPVFADAGAAAAPFYSPSSRGLSAGSS